MALTLEVGTAYDYPTIEDAAAALGLTLTSGRDWSTLDGTIPGMVVNQKMTGTPTTPGVYTVTAREVSIYGDYYTMTADVTVNGPEPEPDPAESTLVPDVLEFLGLPNNPDMVKLAKQHTRIVTTFVRNYVRGNGFSVDGIPNPDIHDVIITATARYLPNPTQASRQSLGNQSIGYASIDGFTLAEKSVLNRYRRRTNGSFSLPSSGSNDLSSYATVEYVDLALEGVSGADVDLTNYVTFADLPAPVDLAPYVTDTELSAALDALPEPEPVDLTGYALKSEIPAPVDLAPYALKTEIPEPVSLAGLATETYVNDAVAAVPVTDLTGYATESYVTTAIDAIPDPEPVDLSPYATTSAVTAMLGNAAKDTGTRDVSSMLNMTNAQWGGSVGGLYLRRIGNLVMFWGSGIKTTKTGAYNVTEALPTGFRPPLANYNGPILTDGSSSFLGTATLRENTNNGSVAYGVNFNVAVLHNWSAFFLTMPCADPWPTTLPGVAV